MMMELLPPLHKVFSLVLQQERNLPVINTADSQKELSTLAIQVQSTGSNSQPSKNFNFGFGNRGRGRGDKDFGRGQQKYCTHCGGDNHIIDNCYVKHGFPPGYKSKGAQFSNAKSVNLASTTNSDSSLVSSSAMATSLNELQGQFQQILNIFQQQTTPNPTLASVNSIISDPVALNANSSPTYEFQPEDDWYS